VSGARSPAAPAGQLRGVLVRWAWLAPILGILVLGLFAYGNSLHGEFAFDDREQVRDNLILRDLGAFLSPNGYRLYRSRFVGYATFALNYRAGGLDVFGYHLTNLIIHLVASLLVYRLVQLAFRTPLVRNTALAPNARGVSFVAGVLFATHPLGTQAVSYIVQRLTSLAALFYLLAVALYLAWRLAEESPGPRGWRRALLYAGVLLGSLLAVRTKEIAFTLPAALVLAELLFFPAGGLRRWLPVAPVGAISLLIPASWIDFRGPIADVAASADRVTRLLTPVSRPDYLKTQAVVVCEYLRLLVWPSGQNLDHDFRVYTSALDPRVLFSLVVLCSLAAFAIWLTRRTTRRPGRPSLDPAFRVVAFGIGWFFVALAVESSVIPIVDVIYEHRAYLPSVGLFAAAATLLGLLFLRVAPEGAGRATVLAGVALALVLGSVTLQRNAVWGNAVTLWSDVVEKSPGKYRPHLNLGESYDAVRRYPEAEREFRRAIEIDPKSIPARTSLATVLQKAGRARDAEAEYRVVLRLDPDHFPAIFNLAELLWSSGRREEAAALYRRYLELAPAASGPGHSIARSRSDAAVPSGAPPAPLPR
jgi:Flp pilus assembly protein TadD